MTKNRSPAGSRGLPALALGALGVVFGDIGTSPLYTLRECVRNADGSIGKADLFGLLSLIVWALFLVVTFKYLSFIMRADNKGEGGIFALLAIVPEKVRNPTGKGLTWLSFLAVVGAALLYGDGVITPAISVLSAVEGLEVVAPALKAIVVPVTCVILLALFAIQRRGTGAVGRMFGPVMLVWFVTMAALGLYHIIRRPEILTALSPEHAVAYFGRHGLRGGLILGSVVLAVTGGEALYADMGHFGIRPIRFAWNGLVLPSLTINYIGQGAVLLDRPEKSGNPFFGLVPDGAFTTPATIALVVLSSMATVIASQALIAGVFSITRQAMLLGYFPRVTVRHTARHIEGQIFIPEMNRLLAIGCVVLVIAFRDSSRLAAAYGIAVTGTMAITSIVFFEVTRHAWRWPLWRALLLLAIFLSFDIPFLVANLFKFREGGYVPLLIGAAVIAAMLIWNRGRTLMMESYASRFPRLEEALPRIRQRLCARVPGTAVFMSSSATNVPHILMHHVDRNRVLHEQVILFTVKIEEVPSVADERRFEITHLEHGLLRLVAHYGFTQQPNVVEVLELAKARGELAYDPEEVTYYLGRENILATSEGAMGRIAERVFAYLSRNAVLADRHFGIPPRQVVEIGTQIDL